MSRAADICCPPSAASLRTKISRSAQPAGLTDVFGMTYDNFTVPVDVPHASEWMELLRPAEGTKILASYGHPAYQGYAAATWSGFGQGSAVWLGTLFDRETLDGLLARLLPDWGILPPEARWPLVVKEGENSLGKRLRYLLNYSARPAQTPAPGDCLELLEERKLRKGEAVRLEPWGAAILEW